MKGMVFTEFVEMVEGKFGDEIADGIIEASDLASGGAYTAVGTYDHKELLTLVSQLSKATGIDVPPLIRAFGKHLLGRFVETHSQPFENARSTFDFL
ncbi:MAG: heme NO-binding domain-containing protein, partial [Planctomycetes bacterium]|nr:heme NO-binding domain-containing protein [Planctomycetota bacterium]